MDITPSSIVSNSTLFAPDKNEVQGARVADQGNGKEALEKSLEEARLRRKDEDKSLKKQQKKQNATLRRVRADQSVSAASKETKAALDIAKALGLDAEACKVLLQKKAPADLAKRLNTMLEKQSPASIEQSINQPHLKAVLGRAIAALNSSDPFNALGLSPTTVCSLVSNTFDHKGSADTAKNFAQAIGEALAMIQTLIGKSAETAALLAKFEEAFEALKALEASNTIKFMQSEQAHYNHEKHKMHALGILKKIFGAIVAAILAAIAAVTGNAGLLAVAVVLVTVTFVPKAMDTICEGYARYLLQLKGKAAEAVALFMRILIATTLTLASGGAAGASMVGSVLSEVGTFTGSFMLMGGAENIANLKVDAEHNCDIYTGDATEREKEEASHDAEIAGYVLLALSGASMISSGAAGLASGESSAATTEATEEVRAEPEIDQAAPEDEGAATDEAEETETEETERDEIDQQSEEKKKEEAKEMRTRKFLRAARYGMAGAATMDSAVGVALGEAMLVMAGIIRDLMTTQGTLSMSQTSIRVANQEMKRDETNDQATTSQAIDSMKNITIDESIAYQHQIVGATAV